MIVMALTGFTCIASKAKEFARWGAWIAFGSWGIIFEDNQKPQRITNG